MLTGLTDGVSYDIQARAVNATGAGPWSATRSAVTTDHGDTRGEATPLALESSVPGRINRTGDQDVFVIVTPRTALLTVTGSGSANIQGSLTTSEGDVLVSSSGSLLNAPRQFSLDATVEAGAYYLTVSHALGGTGSYLLQAELQAQTRVASQSRTALDPNNATVIELDSYAEGTFHRSNGAVQSPILFTFTLDDPTEVWIHSSDSSHVWLDLRAELLTPEDVLLDENDNSYLFITMHADFMFRRSLDAGTYFIRVAHPDTSGQVTFPRPSAHGHRARQHSRDGDGAALAYDQDRPHLIGDGSGLFPTDARFQAPCRYPGHCLRRGQAAGDQGIRR